jgi:cell division protein FtsB
MSLVISAPGDTERVSYIRAALSEIRMLVDYLAASTVRTLDEIKIHDPGSNPPTELNAGQLLLRMDEIEARTADQSYTVSDLALIQVTRDALGRLVRPVSGLTVAYTALVVGNRRGSKSESRATLAQQAYPGLVSTAKAHRWAQRILLAIAVIVTISAVWESAKVALGKSLLQSLAGLRAQQAVIAQEVASLEATLDKLPEGTLTPDTIADHGRVVLAAFALCDRSKVLAHYLPADNLPTDNNGLPLRLSTSPQVRDVCGRDSVLAKNIQIAHDDLIQYRTYWPGMVGSIFNLVGQVASIPCHLLGCRSAPSAVSVLNKGEDDVEFLVAPTLLVWGNYILPVIFGFLGAVIFVILDFFGKIRDSRLGPRDNVLSWIRLVLGLVTGAAVGLFFSAYTPPQLATGTPAAGTADLIASLTLSASGVAFLAGFGVEGVFTLLESLVSRVFASEQGAAPSRLG